MKTITIDDVMKFHLCWEDARERMENIAAEYNRQDWTALDILRLPKTLVNNVDKLWLVLREDLIDAPILHEFACRCAERVLSRIDNPDPRSVAAMAAKRAWLKGEITNAQLKDASSNAHWAAEAAAKTADRAAYCAAEAAAYHAADTACRDAQISACRAAFEAANDADNNACYADATAERAWQVETLIKILEVNDQL